MIYYQSFQSICLLISGVVISGILLPVVITDAQCIDRSTVNIPIWELYGVSPYRARAASSVRFTPLQGPGSLSGQLVCPASNAPLPAVGEVFNGANPSSLDSAIEIVRSVVLDVPELSSGVNPVNDPPRANDSSESTKINTPKEEPDVGSIPSPSDIILSPTKPNEPTPADKSTQVSSSALLDAQAEIKRLKAQLVAARDKARTAIDRAYAAEKAGVAARENAVLKLKKVQELALKQEMTRNDFLIEWKARERRLVKATKQHQMAVRDAQAAKIQVQAELKRALELADVQKKKAIEQALLAQSNARKAKKRKTGGGARKLVERLKADAKAQPDDSKKRDR